MTKQRELVSSVLSQTHRHMTADEIYEEAKGRMPGIARATVYRNLGLMEEDGEVRRIRCPGKPDRFDCLLTPHEHICCPCCGELEDVQLPDLKAYIEAALGRPVEKICINIEALCSHCAQKRRGES